MNRLRRAIGESPVGAALVVPVTDRETSADLARLGADGADAVEFRVDRFTDVSSAAVADSARRAGDLAVLVTIRVAAEGGEWDASDDARAELFHDVLDLVGHVDAIDVELASLSSDGPLRAVVEAARAAGVLVVVSTHDFDGTPPVDELIARHGSAVAAGADIVKLATTADDQASLRRLAALLTHTEHPSAVVAMGALGAASRVFFPVLGSVLTYAHGGRHRLPGQLDVAATAEFLARVSPSS